MPKEDLTGRNRLARNVAFAWGGYLVNVLSGFILPRLVSDHLGQHTLGLWDFTWSIMSYFGLLQLGIGASIERYVARHRARGDNESLATSVSTIGLSFFVSGCLVIVLTVVVSSWGLNAFAHRLGEDITMCRYLVLFLGSELALCMMLAVYGGVIAGCHRWDIHNAISASSYGVATLGMLVALLLGYGLPTLAAIHCICSVAAETTRWSMVRRVCPELRIDYRLASLNVWVEQFRFGVKNLLPRVADLLSNQTLSLLIVNSLGPAALAIYCRPKSLLRSMQTFAAKFGFILIPTSSALDASSDHASLRVTFLQSNRFISSMALPGVLALIIYGDWVIRLWMGAAYVYAGLVSVLAISSFFSVLQEPVWSILSGMNRHGRIGYARLAGAICSASTLAIGLSWFKWQLLGAALAFAIPQMIVDGLFTPAYACRCMGLSLASFYRDVLLNPLLWCSPYLGGLLLSRLVLASDPWLAAACVVLGLLALFWIYFFKVVPTSMRRLILSRLPYFKTHQHVPVGEPTVVLDD